MKIQNSWISVKEKRPKYEQRVLVSTDDQKCAIAFLRNIYCEEWFLQFEPYDDDVWDEEEFGMITHWMPLPEPPKKGGTKP